MNVCRCVAESAWQPQTLQSVTFWRVAELWQNYYLRYSVIDNCKSHILIPDFLGINRTHLSHLLCTIPHAWQHIYLLQLLLPFLLLHPPPLLLWDDVIPAPHAPLRVDLLFLHHGEVSHLSDYTRKIHWYMPPKVLKWPAIQYIQFRRAIPAPQSRLSRCPWARNLTLMATDELAVAVSGWHCRLCVNVWMNGCKSLWTKASANAPKYK